MDLFHFAPTSTTLVAFIAGFVCVGLSALLIPIRHKPYEKVGYFIIRDFLQVFGLGFVLPIWFVMFYRHQSLGSIGLTLSYWTSAVVVDVVMAIALTLIFLKDNKHKRLHFRTGDILYIMVTGIFEVVFFYSFLRYYFELAFGVIPAILLASTFYSLHHIGFEAQMRGSPWFAELSKLSIVGVVYAAVCRISGNVLSIYPLFWGVGAYFDVLIQKEGRSLPWQNALVVLFLMVITATVLIGFR